MVIAQALSIIPSVFLYLLMGIVLVVLSGGRDPLSFGPRWLLVGWPVAVVVAVAAMVFVYVVSPVAIKIHESVL